MKNQFSIAALLILALPCCKPVEVKQAEDITLKAVVHSDTSTINLRLAKGEPSPKTNASSTYYWFAHGKINTAQGYHAGKLLHGPYVEYDRATKKPIASGAFAKGLKTGRWLSWQKDGTLKEIKFFKGGELNGPLVKYDVAGNPKDTLKYKGGKMVLKQVESADSLEVSVLSRIKRFIKLKK